MIGRTEKALLLAASLLTGATGLVFAWMKHVMRGDDPYAVVNHPWQPHVLALHVLAAPLLLFAFGLIARDHIVGRWRDPRARRGRRTGMLAAGILLPMIASGYLIQVLTSRSWRSWLGWLHLGAGVVYLLLLAGHLKFSAPGPGAPGRGSAGGPAQAGRRRRLKRR